MTKDLRRFMRHVEARSDGCWVWIGARCQNGYGRFSVDGKTYSAHRWIFTLRVGPIADGNHVHHKCGNPGCVNPNHLQSVDRAQHAAMHGRPLEEGPCHNLSFRIPAEEYLVFMGTVNRHFKNKSEAAREAFGIFIEKYEPTSLAS